MNIEKLGIKFNTSFNETKAMEIDFTQPCLVVMTEAARKIFAPLDPSSSEKEIDRLAAFAKACMIRLGSAGLSDVEREDASRLMKGMFDSYVYLRKKTIPEVSIEMYKELVEFSVYDYDVNWKPEMFYLYPEPVLLPAAMKVIGYPEAESLTMEKWSPEWSKQWQKTCHSWFGKPYSERDAEGFNDLKKLQQITLELMEKDD